MEFIVKFIGSETEINLKKELLDKSKNSESYKKILETFSDAELIDIKIEEKPTGEISLAAGVGTSGSVIGGGITEKNFLGKGINLDTFIEIFSFLKDSVLPNKKV